MSKPAPRKPNPRRGTSLDDFLESEGVLERFPAAAIKTVIAFQITRAMESENVSKTEMAARMKTTRAQLDRLLDPENGNVTLETIARAAAILGREIRVELV